MEYLEVGLLYIETEIAIEELLDKTDEEHSEISNTLLEIESAKLREKFTIHAIRVSLVKLRIQYALGFVIAVVITAAALIESKQVDSIFFVDLSICVTLFTALVFSMTRSFEVNTVYFSWLLVLAIVLVFLFNSLVRESDNSLVTICLALFISGNFSIGYKNVLFFMGLLVGLFALAFGLNFNYFGKYLWIIDFAMATDNTQLKVFASISICSLVCLALLVLALQRHKMEFLVKREFIAGSVLQSRSNLTKDLLKLLLPSFVLDQMKSFEITGQNIDGDGVDEGDVTILFCDIADFDDVVRQNEDQIVRILDSIFRRFDELCKENGCQKIETVGKTYMACGGLRYVEQTLTSQMRESNPTARILNLSKQMMEEIKNYENLNLKIGVHRGKCMMGVIGYHKPQFSLIGDAINFTSRHCTTGETGHIMVSIEAWAYLTDTNVKARGYTYLTVPTNMKGKGTVDVYHVIPFQGLLRKRLQSIIERYRKEGEEFPEELVTIERVMAHTKQELIRKVANGRINKLLKNVMESAKEYVNKEAKPRISLQLAAEVNIDEQGSVNKGLSPPEKLLSSQSASFKRRRDGGSIRSRSSKKRATKMVNFNQTVIEVPIDSDSSDSEAEEDAEVNYIHPSTWC